MHPLKSTHKISQAFLDFDDGLLIIFIFDMKSADHKNWENKVYEDAEIELKHEEIMKLSQETCTKLSHL